MIGNFKVLGLVALTAAALSAVMASAAQAEPHFFFPGAGEKGETTVKVTADAEEGKNLKTGHQVFDISKADGTGVKSITCNQIHADTKVTGETATELTFNTPTFTGDCSFVGQSVAVENAGCNFLLTASGQLHIKNDEASNCEHGQKPIHWSIPGCKVEVGAQKISSGITHHAITTNGKKAVTIEASVTGISYKATGANCEYGTTSNGKYTTGNSIATGERGGATVDLEWNEAPPPGPKFHSELTATTISSTADGAGSTAHHVLDVAGSSLTCSSVALDGTQSGREVELLTLTAEYSSCTFLSQATSVSMNGCDYVLHADGSFDIASKSGKNCGSEPIKFSATGCKLEIGPQTGLQEATFKNIEPGSYEEITIEMHVANIEYDATGALCPEPGHNQTNGNYTTGNTI